MFSLYSKFLFPLVILSSNALYTINTGSVLKACAYVVAAPIYIEYKCAEAAVKGSLKLYKYMTIPEEVAVLENIYAQELLILKKYQYSNSKTIRKKLYKIVINTSINIYLNALKQNIFYLDNFNHDAAQQLQNKLIMIRNILKFYE